jgi:integrase
VAAIKVAGYYPDGAGLYLQVAQSGAKTWIFRFMLNGRAREMGLGGAGERKIELAEAREKAAEARRLVRDGTDPIEARDSAKKRLALDQARSVPFRDCATAYIAAHRAGWKNAKHAQQWQNTIETYCGPVFGDQPVQAVDTTLVCKVLEPMWTKKPETATRLRARIERVLDWAKVRGYRNGDNPARWRGHLDALLPNLKKADLVKHHPAIHYTVAGAFLAKVRKQEGLAARALEFTALTALRTSDVIKARWGEIDMDAAVWSIPGPRMKKKREHRVPLSPPAMRILKQMRELRTSDYVFPGRTDAKHMSDGAMRMLLQRMGMKGIATTHGFRSTFKDWAADTTHHPIEVSSMALAHRISDKVEEAYRRGDLFKKRVAMMNAWASYCARVKRRPRK